jgi:hypothetical protein
VRNLTPVPNQFPRLEEGLDARGRALDERSGFQRPIAPGASGTITVQVSLREGGGPPAWPLVFRVRDCWVHEVQGTFAEGGNAFVVGGEARCKSPIPGVTYALRDLRLHRFGRAREAADTAWLSNGSHVHLHLPSSREPVVEGQLEAWADAACPAITAIGGCLDDPKDVVLP